MKPESTIFITGTSRGIGKLLAMHYLQQGHTVIGCSRTEPEWEAPSSGTYDHLLIDIGDESSVRQSFSIVRKRYGALQLLVNNAGTFSADMTALTNASTVTRIFQQNVVASFVVTREAVKLMRPAHFGRVVTISSIAVPIAAVGNAFYSASKAALVRISEVMALELKDSGVTLNTIGISFVEGTGMYEQSKPDALTGYRTRLTVERPISVEELAHGIDFFADENAGAINAQCLYFGGPL
jgi:3-oxoacyl-[acyl-carrier protein] reductase